MNFTSSVLHAVHNANIRLITLPSWARDALRLDEIEQDSLERFDSTIEDPDKAWQPVCDGWLAVPEAEGILLRASLRRSFPRHFVADMAAGLNAAAMRLANNRSTDIPALFASVFPDCVSFCLDEFVSAVALWDGLSPSARAKYCDAGHTNGGTWTSLVAQTQHHRL